LSRFQYFLNVAGAFKYILNIVRAWKLNDNKECRHVSPITDSQTVQPQTSKQSGR